MYAINGGKMLIVTSSISYVDVERFLPPVLRGPLHLIKQVRVRHDDALKFLPAQFVKFRSFHRHHRSGAAVFLHHQFDFAEVIPIG